MAMVDPISDMLTRIRNANQRWHPHTDIPASKIKLAILKKIESEGFIRSHKIVEKDGQGVIRVFLKYTDSEERVITDLQRVSRPGRRVYVNTEAIPTLRGGLGVNILSTSKGILTDRESKKENVGGEIICAIW